MIFSRQIKMCTEWCICFIFIMAHSIFSELFVWNWNHWGESRTLQITGGTYVLFTGFVMSVLIHRIFVVNKNNSTQLHELGVSTFQCSAEGRPYYSFNISDISVIFRNIHSSVSLYQIFLRVIDYKYAISLMTWQSLINLLFFHMKTTKYKFLLKQNQLPVIALEAFKNIPR